jgi:uridine kinase
MPVIRTYRDFGEKLLQFPRKRATLLLAVDGCGGSGKSTFAQRLQQALPDAEIVHGDDFYLPAQLNPHHAAETIAADFDLERLRQQVLEPLSQDEAGYYQQYDWLRDELGGYKSVPAGGIVIIEGIYAMLPPLADYYDYAIWVECPYELRLARGLARDGESARDLWVNRWMPAEDRYVAVHQPQQKADLIVDTSEAVQHNPQTEFVCLSG